MDIHVDAKKRLMSMQNAIGINRESVERLNETNNKRRADMKQLHRDEATDMRRRHSRAMELLEEELTRASNDRGNEITREAEEITRQVLVLREEHLESQLSQLSRSLQPPLPIVPPTESDRRRDLDLQKRRQHNARLEQFRSGLSQPHLAETATTASPSSPSSSTDACVESSHLKVRKSDQ